MEYDVTQKSLDQSLRDFDKEMKIYTSKFQSTLNRHQHFFDDFKLEENTEGPMMTGVDADLFLAESGNFAANLGEVISQ